MCRVLISGLGSIGRRHLTNLRGLGVRDILLHRRVHEPLSDAPELPVFTDLTQALALRPDVVIISNPTAYHMEVAIPAARSGCNLFIEKPLSHSWQGVELFLRLVKELKLITLMGFDLRFEPGLCKIKSLLEQESIGHVVAIQAQVGQYLPDWHPWEDYRKGVSANREMGGGVILDLIHELDYVSWLIGPASRVCCLAGQVSSLEIETEDTAAMLLQFENGAIGTVHLDYIQRIPSRTCRIIGETGTILWDAYAKQVSWCETGKTFWQDFNYNGCDRNDRFLAEMRHLLACVDRKESPKTDAVTGARVLKMALAATESALTANWCPVTL
jgi:predicted dehydrogenase